ncbi:MAG: 6-phospho-3-hexuloisomerase [Lachnospiraceae bacterium]
MSYIDTYQKFSKIIVAEHEAVFGQLDMKQLKTFVDAVISAKRVFVHGTGREGISMRGFAMRLAHLGKSSYWLMDDTTVGMHEGDLFIVCDGRGDVGVHRRIVQQAAKTGAKIAMITALPEGNLVKSYADYMLFVHSTVYMDEKHAEADAPKQHDTVPTEQPMGNQYEQHIYLLMDIIAIILKDEMKLTYDDMEANHRNIE